ncbi:DUF397 domain-containing protein [Amycolatopsis alkalitolerans]|uniref:DUF397 domain-containing protein n=1 Tax=Amycolatopsis alkalitolerans TaxID=2547244 RepID=A0A5C4M6X7_9PSEU|nr:DUF397 domain-containing protein [Amycolatopsis alkalitolerans]TNC29004.1 DUF397 domain-containing protein [Amycolatopsis alkalitolerans]
MTNGEFAGGTWRKSSYSGGGNDCVEVALLADRIGVRDSKNPGAGALSVSPSGWRGFLRVLDRD